MKVNDKLYGFKVNKVTSVGEIGADLYQMEHEKSGARLIYLDREDENKTFSIAFKTIPENSTGVFHILEHSVLCGSEKFTTKEPFVELLKGSLNTFLNAMTYPDKTVYPVASRNDKDFFNLMSVYLDAVFHPALLKQPNIFRQEGWHYELESADGAMTRSGVVLNEMRGAFSSADEVADYHLKDMLFPDTCYRYESGGEPAHISDLTYEAFCAAHKKYYHPSNSEMFLDGSVKLDEVLPYIDSVLSEYDRQEIDFDVAWQPAIKPQSREIKYEIAPNETVENKTRLEIGYLTSSFEESEKTLALTVLFDALTSTNEAPLKKAILASGLCEDMNVNMINMKQGYVTVSFRNIKDGKCDELYTLFNDTVKSIAAAGIDKKALEASLNNLEFKTREKNYGTMPVGLIYALTILDSSLYGGDPVQNLAYSKDFDSIRTKLAGDYYEKLLLSVFTENKHRATLVMHPSSTLGEERAKADAEELANIKASLSEKELADILEMNKALKEWQQKPDTPEDLATIPQLKISDISAEVEKIPQTVSVSDGVTVLTQNIATNGIVYTSLCFDASDLTESELFDLRMLLSLITNVNTAKHGTAELQNLIKSELGNFSVDMSSTVSGKDAKIYVTVQISALESKKKEIVEIAKEILYTSRYDDKETAHNILRQLKMASDQNFTSAGHMAAMHRAAAYTSALYAIDEYYNGYEAHLAIKALEKDFDEKFDALSDRISALAKRIFTRERLTVSVTGKPDSAYVGELISMTERGEKINCVSGIKPLGIRREGIVIPAQASYASIAADINIFGEKYSGSLGVASSLLSYGYLWGAVRVQGGAYGVGLLVRKDGMVSFYSYRDPTPARTLGCYTGSSAFLREFAKSGEDVTKFIIGAVRSTSPLTSPMLKGTLATSRYLNGITYEDECRVRREIIGTGAAELNKVADILDRVCAENGICVIAGKDKLDTCENLDSILEI